MKCNGFCWLLLLIITFAKLPDNIGPAYQYVYDDNTINWPFQVEGWYLFVSVLKLQKNDFVIKFNKNERLESCKEFLLDAGLLTANKHPHLETICKILGANDRLILWDYQQQLIQNITKNFVYSLGWSLFRKWSSKNWDFIFIYVNKNKCVYLASFFYIIFDVNHFWITQ